jgi:phosphatidylglycerophosphatase A
MKIGKVDVALSKRGLGFSVRGPADALAVAVATGLGAGFAPVAPGTFGSLVGLLIAYGLIELFKFEVLLLQNSLLLLSVGLTALGVWAAARAEKIFDRKDAGQIVIDEVCGQLISFAFVAPYLVKIGGRWRWALLVGFALFRAFDVFKPYPLRRLEGLGGGLGVMADDVLAGVYVAVALSFLLLVLT